MRRKLTIIIILAVHLSAFLPSTVMATPAIPMGTYTTIPQTEIASFDGITPFSNTPQMSEQAQILLLSIATAGGLTFNTIEDFYNFAQAFEHFAPDTIQLLEEIVSDPSNFIEVESTPEIEPFGGFYNIEAFGIAPFVDPIATWLFIRLGEQILTKAWGEISPLLQEIGVIRREAGETRFFSEERRELMINNYSFTLSPPFQTFPNQPWIWRSSLLRNGENIDEIAQIDTRGGNEPFSIIGPFYKILTDGAGQNIRLYASISTPTGTRITTFNIRIPVTENIRQIHTLPFTSSINNYNIIDNSTNHFNFIMNIVGGNGQNENVYLHFPDNILDLIGREIEDVVININIVHPPTPEPTPSPSPSPSPSPTPTPPSACCEEYPDCDCEEDKYPPSDDNENDDSTFWTDLGNFFLSLFVPSENFFQTQFNQLETQLQARLPFQTFIDAIGRLREVSGRYDGDASVLNIDATYGGQRIQVDIGNRILPHLRDIRTIVTGLYVIFLAYYNYRQIMFLIRGTNYQSMNGGGHR